jgi:hypothetical protein
MERNVKHFRITNAEVKKEWSYTSTPPICLQGVEMENRTFTLNLRIRMQTVAVMEPG